MCFELHSLIEKKVIHMSIQIHSPPLLYICFIFLVTIAVFDCKDILLSTVNISYFHFTFELAASLMNRSGIHNYVQYIFKWNIRTRPIEYKVG